MNSNKTITVLEDAKINVKLKLSALWTAVMLCYAYGDIVGFFKPGFLKDVIAGNMGPLGPTTQGLLLGVAIFISIPGVMVFLSLTLTPPVNRWVNIVLGAIYTVIMIITMFMDAWAYYIFLGVVEVALTTLIVWYGWKWPRHENS